MSIKCFSIRGELLLFLNREIVQPPSDVTSVSIESPEITERVNSDNFKEERTYTFLQPEKVIQRRRKRKGKGM